MLHCVPIRWTHDLVELGYRAREVFPGSPFAIERLRPAESLRGRVPVR